MIFGSLCLMGSCTGKGKGKGKGRDYLLKPAGMFYAFAGGLSKTTSLQFILQHFWELLTNCTHFLHYQVSVASSHWRWCVNQWNAWLRARKQSGSNTTTPGHSRVPVLDLSSSFSLALPCCFSPCRRCLGIHGRLAWTPSRTKWSDDGQMITGFEESDCVYCFEYIFKDRFNSRTGHTMVTSRWQKLVWGVDGPEQWREVYLTTIIKQLEYGAFSELWMSALSCMSN